MFEGVRSEKDVEKLKRHVMRDDALYADFLAIRDELAHSWSNVIVKRKFAPPENGEKKMPSNAEILLWYKKRVTEGLEDKSEVLEQALKKLKVRSNSGVAVVSLLTKPYACPGRCIYCPTEANMPKSYLSKEPAAARALANKFDPDKQISSRLRALEMNGHPVDKVEMIMIGGTWSYYKRDYQDWFTKESFRACNNFHAPDGLVLKEDELSLEALQKINETAPVRIIGLSIETRPDYVNLEELNNLRRLGVTKVEIGVQHLDQYVLDFNRREMTVEAIAESAELLRNTGLKIVYHMMPNLPKSNPEMDVQMFKDLFSGKDHHPDMLKVYPCVILKSTLLYKWWSRKELEYQPYDDETLTQVLADCEREVPEYVRIIRIIRDIPATYIVASSKKSNLRESVDEYQEKRGVVQKDIRAREIRDREVLPEEFELTHVTYETKTGTEIFLQFENKKENSLAAFCRLRLPRWNEIKGFEEHDNLSVLPGKALIRELHTYGRMAKIGAQGEQSQHMGFGRRLVIEAERIAKERGYEGVAIIAGVGVREYYNKKLGYTLDRTYMVKKFI